jgi:hypothetical protein
MKTAEDAEGLWIVDFRLPIANLQLRSRFSLRSE